MRTPATHEPAPSPSDGALASLATRGDSDAFRRLHDRHDARMRRIATSMLGTAADAEDAVQEAWIRIHARLARLRGDARPWINVVVRNEARRLGARRGRGDVPVEVLPEKRDPTGEPQTRLEVGERLNALTAVVSRMSDDDRRTLALCAEGACPADIAEALGVSPGTARVRTHRARRRVTERLAECGLAA